jgi:hypothetical protein
MIYTTATYPVVDLGFGKDQGYFPMPNKHKKHNFQIPSMTSYIGQSTLKVQKLSFFSKICWGHRQHGGLVSKLSHVDQPQTLSHLW